MRERPSDRGLESLPGRTEVARALGKMKNGKASGSSNILPEMAKDEKNNLNFLDMLVDDDNCLERAQCSKEWADAIIVPIPKKGNLKSCDNW